MGSFIVESIGERWESVAMDPGVSTIRPYGVMHH